MAILSTMPQLKNIQSSRTKETFLVMRTVGTEGEVVVRYPASWDKNEYGTGLKKRAAAMEYTR